MAIICRQHGILFYNDSKYNVYSLPVTCSAPITGGFVPSHDILDPQRVYISSKETQHFVGTDRAQTIRRSCAPIFSCSFSSLPSKMATAPMRVLTGNHDRLRASFCSASQVMISGLWTSHYV